MQSASATPNISDPEPKTLSINPTEGASNNRVTVREFKYADYQTTHDHMLNLTLARIEKKKKNVITPDELWVVEHNDVYTLGQAGKEEHILQRGDTPIIHTDRGGQVTWHGKGQLVLYWLFDLENIGWSVRDMVSHAEQSIEDVINESLNSAHGKQDSTPYNARARRDAPGVYIYNQLNDENEIMLGKIASLGFKIKHGFSYHGIAVNLNCDLAVFNSINPCGYAGMQMLRLADFVSLTHNTQPLDNTDNTCENNRVNSQGIHHLQFTQDLIDNIKLRQAGQIALREVSG